jgi:sarcosine oxidase subunit alpha
MTAFIRSPLASRSETISFSFDGRALLGHRGESIAAALGAEGVTLLRTNRIDGTPRGAFCFMGICQECAVFVDGRRVEACRTTLTEGLVILSSPPQGP